MRESPCEMPFPEVQSQLRRLSKTRDIPVLLPGVVNFSSHSVILASVQGPLPTPPRFLCCPNPPASRAQLGRVEEVLGFQMLFALMLALRALPPQRAGLLIPTSSASPEAHSPCPGTVASCTVYTGRLPEAGLRRAHWSPRPWLLSPLSLFAPVLPPHLYLQLPVSVSPLPSARR